MKEQLLKRFMRLKQKTLKGNVRAAETDEFNLLLVMMHDEANIQINGLSITEREWQDPVRHPDEGPLRPEEQGLRYVDGDKFRTSLNQAIARLNAYVPPKDSIGFVR